MVNQPVSPKTKKMVEMRKSKKKLFSDCEDLLKSTDPGTFVLVRFVVRGTDQYFAGYIVAETGDGYEVKFLRKMAVKKPAENSVRFYYPEEDDIKNVTAEQLVLSFDKPEVKKASKRQACKIILQHEKLPSFQPIY